MHSGAFKPLNQQLWRWAGLGSYGFRSLWSTVLRSVYQYPGPTCTPESWGCFWARQGRFPFHLSDSHSDYRTSFSAPKQQECCFLSLASAEDPFLRAQWMLLRTLTILSCSPKKWKYRWQEAHLVHIFKYFIYLLYIYIWVLYLFVHLFFF